MAAELRVHTTLLLAGEDKITSSNRSGQSSFHMRAINTEQAKCMLTQCARRRKNYEEGLEANKRS
ncbi:MAG: hypothetical protein OEY99_08545 [Aigarchaeota archaeon]|nr:hypothetical protein [Aigarchaeota archaeon]